MPASVTDPLGNSTTFQYDALGARTAAVYPGTAPLVQRTQTTAYDDLGRVIHVDGAKTYPLSYEYDLDGRMTALIDGNGSRTQWAYDSMGRLATKTYADGSAYEYEYDDEGRLASRTDGKGVTTSYAYDALGRLVTIDYPTDPDVTTVYDALGRKTSVTDATGTWAYAYDGVSSRVVTVTDPDGNVLSYAYDACGARASMSLTVGTTTVTDLDYTYPPSPLRDYGGTSTDGRLTQIDAPGTAGVPPALFTYSYLAGSNLVSSLVHTLTGENQVPLTTTRTWDDADRLLTIASVGGATPATLTSYAYTLDAQGRRIRRDDLDGTHLDWSYNARDELTAAVRSGYPASEPFGAYPYTYSYTFDSIGNHLRQDKNGTVFTARYNNLNQLLEREVTGPVRVQGNADGVLPIGVKVDGAPADTATVDQDTAAWRGDSRPIQPGQTGQKQISIVATDSAEPPKKTESVRTVELPSANPVPFTYDLNGNMADDGLWVYTWDTENRLVRAEIPGGRASPRAALVFTYDSNWRRRTKSVYAWATDRPGAPEPGEGGWSLITDHLFVYDGWNLIYELITDHTQTPAASTAESYVWGLDIAGMQGAGLPAGDGDAKAGGVGGLLSATCHSTPATCHFFCYDSNGNVTALVSATDGSVVAQYDYSPFGETVMATAETNPFRFSTKCTDSEAGLVYYGFRYLAPTRGRWVSRDPVGEEGGTNLSGFVRNKVTGALDPVGLYMSPGTMAFLGELRRTEEARRLARFLELDCIARETAIAIRQWNQGTTVPTTNRGRREEAIFLFASPHFRTEWSGWVEPILESRYGATFGEDGYQLSLLLSLVGDPGLNIGGFRFLNEKEFMSGDPFAVIAHMAEEAEHDSSCYGRWLHDYDPYARAGAGDVFGQLFLSAKRVLEFLPSHDPSSANRLEEIRCRCRRQDN